MHRSLRFQLIAIVVLAVAVVPTFSQWVNIRLSENALEQDMKQRALLVLRTVDSLWGRTEARVLHDELAAIVEGDREIVAIDIFRLNRGVPELDISAHETGGPPATTLTAPEVAELSAKGPVTKSLPDLDGTERLRIAVPLRRAGAVELWAAGVTLLKQRLRAIHGVVLVASAVLISLLLALFLERRVSRPVTMLVDVMRRAERGERGIRAQTGTGGEFGFLTGSLNRMLSRIEDLTASLEERVRVATRDLAEKNRELQVANERLWQAQLEVGRGERLAALGQMAGTLAHELGTPLNSVLGYIQLLLREDLRSKQREELAIVESQVQRMIDIIRSILDRTRDAPLRRTAVALPALVSEALTLVSAQLSARNLVTRVDVPADLPTVSADAVGIRQVLLNLLTNAIDAMDQPGSIRVTAAVVARNGQRGPCLEVAVQDDGHGMSPDELQRAFEPFYTTKAPGRGTGLGLVIVDHIVHAHGGQLVAESAPGRGTTMRVRLPLES
jgi:signal transduction histidine kinase